MARPVIRLGLQWDLHGDLSKKRAALPCASAGTREVN